MKKIEAIIKPFTIDAVRAELERIGVSGLTTYEVRGIGRHPGLDRGFDPLVEFKPKLKLEIVVRDEQVDAAIVAIRSKARTGRVGDGKICVSPVLEAVRIRTHEHGDAAV